MPDTFRSDLDAAKLRITDLEERVARLPKPSRRREDDEELVKLRELHAKRLREENHLREHSGSPTHQTLGYFTMPLFFGGILLSATHLVSDLVGAALGVGAFVFYGAGTIFREAGQVFKWERAKRERISVEHQLAALAATPGRPKVRVVPSTLAEAHLQIDELDAELEEAQRARGEKSS